MVSFKPTGLLWHQFKFDLESEFWGFINAISHVQSLRSDRRDLIGARYQGLQDDFLVYFKPKIAPDATKIQRLRAVEEENKRNVAQQAQERREGRARYSEESSEDGSDSGDSEAADDTDQEHSEDRASGSEWSTEDGSSSTDLPCLGAGVVVSCERESEDEDNSQDGLEE